MCPKYCFGCDGSGVIHTWGGDVECFCMGPCEHCGADRTTATHRHYCKGEQLLRAKLTDDD